MTRSDISRGPAITGRAAQAAATRSAILASARELFLASGFDAVSVRAIAQRADADPALVIRHFGSKEELFMEALPPTPELSAIVDGPLETLGRRLIAYHLAAMGQPEGRTAMMVLRSAGRERVRELLLENTLRSFRLPLARRMRGDDAELRSAMVWAQTLGLVSALGLGLPELEGDDEAIIARYGDAVQSIIDD